MKTISLVFLVFAASAAAPKPADPVKTELFTGGEGGYKIYRIPALVATGRGTLIAFCAARKDHSDWAEIAIAMRRSTDGGKTWEPMRILAKQGTSTVDNPTPIADKDGSLHFLYQVNYARLYYLRSHDDGKTFSDPVELTSVVEPWRAQFNWTVIAPGPGHAIQLKNGRLLVPLWMSTDHSHRPSVVATLYSDDHGRTWNRGEILPAGLPNPSESVAVQLLDGRVMLNIRNESTEHRRAIAYSPDGAGNWTRPEFNQQLYEPVCMAASIRFNGKDRKSRILFSNPNSIDDTTAIIKKHEMRPRNNLTIRMSYDEGQTWPVMKLLEGGLTGYSDLAIGKDGAIYCLYEHGVSAESKLNNSNIGIARFSLQWLEN